MGKAEASAGSMSRLSAGVVSQSTLNRTYVFCRWAFGARVCWLSASAKACVCTDGLRPGRNCYPAAARGASNRLELATRALILLPRRFPSRIADARSMSRPLAVFLLAVPELTRSADINISK